MPANSELMDATIRPIPERRAKALNLAMAGVSYRKIAQALDVSVRQAYVDVQCELESIQDLRREQAEHARELSLAKLDGWTLALSPKAQTGDVQSIKTLLRIEERRSRLLGLDAPTRVAPTDPAGERPYREGNVIDVRTLSTETLRAILRETADQQSAPR